MVSIIIPNYNGIKYLRACIDSLYRYMPKTTEIIIIDNASTDDEYTWIEKMYPDILFKRLDKNYGFSRAVNEGIKMAQGEYVLLLNNDTEIMPNFIQALVECIQTDSKIFGVSSKMIAYHDQRLIDDAGDEYTLLGWTRKRGDGESVAGYTQTEEVFSACAGAALYRRAIFEEIGYFDEHFFAYMEDVDISYRARIYGYKNMYCAEAKVLHIGSATSGSRYNDFKVRLAARNNIYVPYKNMPWLQLIFNAPFFLVGCLVKYIFFLRKGYGKAYKEGFIEGIKTLGSLQKVPFKISHLKNYLNIEMQLITNTFNIIRQKFSYPLR